MNGNENSKTLWFLAAAALLVGVAWISRPVAAIKNSETAKMGEKLFRDFTEPGDVDSLEVLQFDQAKGDANVLKVAKVNGLWVIPSHSSYPADAKDHLAAAANSLIDLTILGMAPGFTADPTSKRSMDEASLRKAYNKFGVIDPDPKKVKVSDDGIGTRVTMSSGGRELASAIIGKAVPDQSDQFYVRVAGKEPVYIVKLDASKLSVRFDDWIEPNLLSLNTMDLKNIEIKDYSVSPMLDRESGGLVLASAPKGEFLLDAPSGDKPWKLNRELVFDEAKKGMVPRVMAADEEVNTSTLDALKSALEDLKIVDVERKPAAVPADLRVRKLDDESRMTLAERGFFPVTNPLDRSGPQEILSKAGDISIQLSDGARYILRFGVTTGESSAAKKKAAKSESEDKAKDDSSPGMDRYLFVAADFNQDAIAKPVFDKLPEEKPADKAPEKKADEKKAPEAKADNKDAKPADAAKKSDDKAEPAKKADDKKDAAKKDEPKKDDVKKEESKKDEPKKDAAKEAKDPAALAAERKRIETENKRRQDEYDSKVTAGKKHAKELGDRFAQWYYVIPGQTYAKIHLDRKEIVKKKEPPKENKDAAGHDHDHDHDHAHEGADALPASPGAKLEELKKDVPAAPAEEKK